MEPSRSKGFEIAVDVRHHILRCRLWGIWNLDLTRKYKHALAEKIAEVRENGEGWCALIDFEAFSPASEEVQRLIRDYLTAAETQGMTQLVYLGDTPALRRRLARIFDEDDFVFAEPEEQAMQGI